MCVDYRSNWAGVALRAIKPRAIQFIEAHGRCPTGLRGISGFDPKLINYTQSDCKRCHVCLITYSRMWDVLMAQSQYFFMISLVAVSLWRDSSTHTHTQEKKNVVGRHQRFPWKWLCLRKNSEIANSLNPLKSFKTQPSRWYPWFFFFFFFTHLVLQVLSCFLLSVLCLVWCLRDHGIRLRWEIIRLWWVD